MLIIPTQPIPSQTFQIVLNNQNCQLNIYQRYFGLFMDVYYVGPTLIIAGVICQNLNYIVRSLYLGFSGDFVFWDTQGSSNPYYTGLGSRYQLVYLPPSDLPPTYGRSI
jgi:hypothetical protein